MGYNPSHSRSKPSQAAQQEKTKIARTAGNPQLATIYLPENHQEIHIYNATTGKKVKSNTAPDSNGIFMGSTGMQQTKFPEAISKIGFKIFASIFLSDKALVAGHIQR